LERERNPTSKAGLRTFALAALFGTLAAILAAKAGSGWILAAGLLSVAALIIAAYFGDSGAGDRGTTTQVALLLSFVYGAMVGHGEGAVVIMLAIVTTMLLYFKPELQGFSKKMERRDMLSILQFGVLSFIILPILPDQGYGPYKVLNPQNIWLMVVLLSGISLAGYIALRLVGARYGAPLMGVMGGLVSSTATTLMYARHSKGQKGLLDLTVQVILLANLVVLVRIAVICATIAPKTFMQILPVLGGGLVLGLVMVFRTWRQLKDKDDAPMPEMQNPAELRASLLIGLIYAAVLFLSAFLADYAGSKGLYAVAVVSGLTDMDAITLSSLRLHNLGQIEAAQAVIAITIAMISNMVFKFGLITSIGSKDLARHCLPGMAAIVVGLAVGALFI
jgi:uncharacterized membrane protein (DUF4010 family)